MCANFAQIESFFKKWTGRKGVPAQNAQYWLRPRVRVGVEVQLNAGCFWRRNAKPSLVIINRGGNLFVSLGFRGPPRQTCSVSHSFLTILVRALLKLTHKTFRPLSELHTVTFIFFDTWPWPWTFVIDRVSRDETLYQILRKSNNTQRSYWWFRAHFHRRYVTLWLWPLTRWPWTNVADRVSCVQTLYQIRAKSIDERLSYWIFSKFLPSLPVTLTFDLTTLNFYSISGVMWQNLSEIGQSLGEVLTI